MLVERISNNNPQKKIIDHAVEILKRGGILVIPTETAYGLVCDATNEKAVRKVYKIKGRSFKKFLPLVCSSINQIKKCFKTNKKELGLFKKYKGVSIIVETRCPLLGQGAAIASKKDIYLLKNQETCAVRVSTNDVVRLLVRKLGKPITATSANVSGRENCYSVEEVINNFKRPLGRFRDYDSKNPPKGGLKYIDLILDAGKLKKRKPSTIVKVEGDNIKVLRQGEVKVNKT